MRHIAEENALSPIMNRVIEEIDSTELSDFAFKLVSTPSETGSEEQVAILVAEKLKEIGLEVKLDYVQKGSPNVIARIRGEESGRNLLLNGHLDTIPIGNCIPPKIADGNIYGRGSLDMKGNVAAMVEAAAALIRSGVQLRGDVLVTGAVCHEVATSWPYEPVLDPGSGVRHLLRSVSKGELDAKAAIVVEGYSDRIVIATKGVSFVDIQVSGSPGALHATSVPFESSPIRWMGELTCELARFNKQLRKQTHPLTGEASLNFGIVSGGDYWNRVPHTCRIVGGARWNVGHSMDELTLAFTDILNRLSRESNLEFRLDKHRLIKPPYEIPPTEEIVICLTEAVEEVTSRRIEPAGAQWGCDASIFSSEGGIPTVHYGSADPETFKFAHSDLEYQPLRNLATLAKVCVCAAVRYCGVA